VELHAVCVHGGAFGVHPPIHHRHRRGQRERHRIGGLAALAGMRLLWPRSATSASLRLDAVTDAQ